MISLQTTFFRMALKKKEKKRDNKVSERKKKGGGTQTEESVSTLPLDIFTLTVRKYIKMLSFCNYRNENVKTLKVQVSGEPFT